MKILFTGGGTGGHVFPIIEIAREIRKIAPFDEELNLVYIGPSDKWAFPYLEAENIEIKPILSGKLRRYLSPQALVLNFIDIFKLIIGIFQAFFWIFVKNPDIVFSKGGYGSLPVVIAAKILFVPIFMHESDISPGLANRLAGKFALEVFTAFPKTEYFNSRKMITVGTPIRRNLLQGSKAGGEEILRLSGQRKTILIMGGSQGSQTINELILLIIPDLLKRFEIVHQCGSRNFNQVIKEAQAIIPDNLKKFYHLFPFMSEAQIREAYFNADLIVSRAGSGSIFEIAALAKPSILIPLPEAAQDHQLKNAHAFAKNGAAIVIEEANITPHFLLTKISSLLGNPVLLQKMAQAAKEFSRSRASEIIANYIIEYLKL
jgi:UDP-N-acetylglucosamine--N-acetylmuramyl-(pentapeptide) pyrophosphoryl-undecaprenol N-acetylglucosamine transferase